jgi:hypothetical protein
MVVGAVITNLFYSNQSHTVAATALPPEFAQEQASDTAAIMRDRKGKITRLNGDISRSCLIYPVGMIISSHFDGTAPSKIRPC